MPGTWGRVRTGTLALAVAVVMVVTASPVAAEEVPPPPAEPTPAEPTPVVVPPPSEEPPPAGDTVLPDPPPPNDPEPAEKPKPPKSKIKFKPVKRYNVLKKLVFPVVGPARYHAGFGDCRDNCTREHHGIDIFTYGWKGQPIVAAHDGVVTKVTYDEGNPGCSVRIRGRDRWETRYYHLNNDFPGTDEIGAPCPVPGIEVGTKVVAGQIIGYMGDSGNAETTPPHLHFELRNRSGYPIDPYRSLRKASKVDFEWLPADTQAATVAISESTYPKGAGHVIVLSSEAFAEMTSDETGALVLQAPVIAVDPTDPADALAEIRRLEPTTIVVHGDGETHAIEQMVRPMAPIVDTASLPEASVEPEVIEPDAIEPEPYVHNPTDRFVTVLSGVVDRIYRSKRPFYESFHYDHNVVVLTTERWAPRGVGVRVSSRLSRYADRSLFWWLTADGWVGTEVMDDPPYPGIAYVTERRVDAATVGFLGSLAELPPHPMWR
ncbi:MAG: M23 family metallopeptidase [Acidimicrobiia bacterium]|nr:M23 family metallopeptidase [Acidimicrobiia bacterium]